jgi:hypothetical protein
MTSAREDMTEGAFQKVGYILTDAKNRVREEAQQKTAADIIKIVNKLQTSTPIEKDEIELIRAWIVGDAVSYKKMESNFQEWLLEYQRLEQLLADYERRDCSSMELLDLHGILESVTRVCFDIVYCLEKRDRIRKFDLAVADGLDDHEREVFARVLLTKLRSEED